MKTQVDIKVSRFFSSYPLRRYAKGDIVLFPDGTIPPVLYITKGKIGQYDIADNGSKAMLNIYQSPAFVPVVNAISNTPNKLFYEAIVDTHVREASPEAALEFLKANPDVMLDLLARLSSGIDGLLGKMTQLMAGTARSRLLFELLIAADRFSDKDPEGVCSVRFTESQLAQQTGLARETVSRELQKLKKEGAITTSKGNISIHTTRIVMSPL